MAQDYRGIKLIDESIVLMQNDNIVILDLWDIECLNIDASFSDNILDYQQYVDRLNENISLNTQLNDSQSYLDFLNTTITFDSVIEDSKTRTYSIRLNLNLKFNNIEYLNLKYDNKDYLNLKYDNKEYLNLKWR